MPSNEIWTIGRILKWTEQYFSRHGIDTPRLDAEVLLSHLLNKKRIYLYVNFEKPLSNDELASYRDFIKRRCNREPVAYIVGEKEFMGLPFAVSPSVLVPQPDTETLVGAVMDRLKGEHEEHILDIGTGSGAIILSLLHFMPLLTGTATDISSDALDVATANAVALDVMSRVKFLEGDLIAPIKGSDETFDAIVSNPPYIKTDEIKTLSPEVQAEPHLALDGGADGLNYYRRIISDAPAFIKDGGFLAFEVGSEQAKDVIALAENAGKWSKTEKISDLRGLARVVILWK
ncbi:MAG: peptide chain release factor N(5)-glutamine methyltransferase [Schwartzia sp.]|nr:peptide chain release factor N(5)-glutamine methyltransferase [Schwartzia sp. (in: firmicutes)]